MGKRYWPTLRDLTIEEIEDLSNSLIHLHHERWVDRRKRSLDQATIIYGPELVNQKIRVLSQSSAGGDSDTKGLRIINKVGCKGNNKR